MTGTAQAVKIFIINLERSVERRAEMVRKMELLGLQYEFFSAVNGHSLPQSIIAAIQEQPYSFTQAYGRKIIPGEIGCAMSHLRLYQKIVSEQISAALILEDDIDIDDRLAFLVKHPRLPHILKHEKELILTGYSTDGSHYRVNAEMSYYKRQQLGKGITLGIPTAWNWSTIGYLVSFRGAEKLLAQGELPRIPADFLTANSPRYNVKLGIVNEPLVWPGEMDDISHIGGGRGHPKERKLLSPPVDTSVQRQRADLKETGKQLYRDVRRRCQSIRKKTWKQFVKMLPFHYLYVSDKF